MNKKLLALAIAGALSVPFAAQADSSNVSIYGIMHMSYDFVDDDNAAGTTTDDADDVTGVNRGSRIGFKGTEDLGNGMKALFLIESNLNNGGVGDRLTYGGVSGGFGTVLLGRQYKPYKLATASLDFWADTVADYNEIISNGYDDITNGGNTGGTGGTYLNYESAANAVAYISPKFSGAQFAIGRVSADAAEEAGDEETEGLSLSVTYGAGPLYVGFGWENQTAPTTGAGTGTDADAMKIGAGYSMGDAKVGFIWENVQVDRNGAEIVDRDRYYINGSFKMGANTLMAAYGDMDSNGAVAGSNDGGSIMSVGVSHAMSARTSAYAIYSATDNDTNGQLDLNNYVSRGAGLDASAFSIGMIHKF